MDLKAAFVFVVLNVSFGIYCFIFLPSLMDGRRDWIIYGSASVLLLLSLLQVACLVFANYVAPNGKFMDTNAKPLTLPNYLAWWTMEQPAFIIPTVSLAMHVQSGRPVPPTAFFLLFFILHYFQRAFIYPWMSRGRPYPIWPNYIGAVIFCTMNGSAQANDLLHGNYSHYLTTSDLLHPRVFIGLAIFFCGWILNLQADNILRNLRKPGEQSG